MGQGARMPIYADDGAGNLLIADGSRVSYKNLSVNAEFTVSSLAINKSRSLVALASLDRVAIWNGNPLSSAKPVLPFTSLGAQVLDVKWSPSARGDSGLVALTTKELISIYCSPGRGPVIERVKLSDGSGLPLEPAAFTFGSDDSPIGDLTVYVATKDGDIYSLAPFVFPDIELTQARLDAASEFISLSGWPTSFDSWSTRLGKVKVLRRPSRARLPSPVGSEPLMLTPYPEELYNEQVLDIRAGDIGWSTDVIVITTPHFVNFFARPDPLADTLVLVSSVKFTKPRVMCRIECITPSIVLVNTEAKTFALYIDKWTTQLDTFHTSKQQGQIDLPATTVEAIPLSYVHATSREVVAQPLSGDASASRKWSRLPAAVAPDDVATAVEELDLNNADESFIDTEGLESDTKATLKLVSKPAPQPRVSLGANLASLKDLESLADAYQGKAALLYKLLLELQRERSAQVRELHSQLALASETHKRLANHNQEPSRKQAIELAVERQQKILSRLHSVSEVVRQTQARREHQPPSAAEEAWFEELRNTLPQRVEATQKHVTALRKSVGQLKPKKSSPGPSTDPLKTGVSWPQILNMQERLRKQDLLITSLKSKLSVS